MRLQDNDDIFARRDALLLVDAAGANSYYTADITRTFPMNGVWRCS
jgi:Xaa-Pro aminopeptidase